MGNETCRICGGLSSYDEYIDDGRHRFYFGYCSDCLTKENDNERFDASVAVPTRSGPSGQLRE